MTSGAAHDHIRNDEGIPYHIRQHFPLRSWIVVRDDSHQTNPEAALIHWFTTSICVCDITGNMNIQGGVQDFTHKPVVYKYKQMGRIPVQNC